MSFVVLCIYVVLDIIRPELIFGEGSSGIMLVVGVAMMLTTAVHVLRRGWLEQESNFFALGLLVAGVLSSTITALTGDSEAFDKVQDLMKAVLIYSAVTQCVNTDDKLTMMRRLVTCSIVALAVGGVLWSLGLDALPFSLDHGNRLQYVGILSDSNDLAMMFAIAWSLLFFSLVNRKRRFSGKVLLIAALVALTWALLLTSSRGAMLALGTALFLIARRRFGVMLPLLLALGLLVTANRLAISRMDKMYSDEDSAEGRLNAWGQGWYMLRSNPALGVGPRNFTENHARAAHSSLVQIASETGLIGLFFWLGFFYFPLREVVFFWRRDPQTTSVPFEVEQLQTALAACLVAGLFLSRAYVSTPYLLSGMTMAARGLHKDEFPEGAMGLSFKKLAVVQVVCLIGWRVLVRNYVVGL